MIESQNCIDFLKQKENMPLYLSKGISSPRWDDIGKCWDIGYGTRFYPNGKQVTCSDIPINEELCSSYLKYNADKCCVKASAAITGDLKQSQFDSLICFAYNEGITSFVESTLLKVINANPNDLINIHLQFRRWKYAQGKIINGLVKRREEEFRFYISELDLTRPIYADYVEWIKENRI